MILSIPMRQIFTRDQKLTDKGHCKAFSNEQTPYGIALKGPKMTNVKQFKTGN